MRPDRFLTLICLMLAGCGVTRPQRESQSNPAQLKFSIHTTRGAAEDLVLDRFLFDGAPVEPKTLHAQTLSPGVHEVTADAASIGDWEFAIRDLSNYYGFGERFDRLDHVHSILKNETRNTAGVKGNDTYKPVPFFMSLRGYGLWVDTFSDATFDLNVTDATRIRVGVRGKKLRFVLFEGPRFLRFSIDSPLLPAARNCPRFGRSHPGKRVTSIATSRRSTKTSTAIASLACPPPSS